MSINLPADSALAQHEQLSFADLKNNTFLSPQEIGFWKNIYHTQIPDSKFIFQGESMDYNELLNYSSLPFFTTNLTKLDQNWGKNPPGNRILKPLTDSIAHQQFYVCFLKRNKTRLEPLIQKLQDQWVETD